MEINGIETAAKELIEFWKLQKIVSSGNAIDDILHFESSKGLKLPDDFRRFFLLTNGMADLFPNYFDDKCFLFYPLQALSILDDEQLGISRISSSENYLIFADYMNRSWWYGVKFSKFGEDYQIVIISSSVKVITQSLAEFIRLYIVDAPVLYDYE